MSHYDQFNIQTAAIMSKSKRIQKVYSTPVIVGGDSTVYQRAHAKGVEIPPEMLEFIEVMILGADKYAPNNWLLPNGTNSDHKSMHASMFRHIASSSAGIRVDKDSGLDHLLNAACRCLMMYTRIKRGLA